MIDVAPELIAFLKEEYDRCRDDALEDERTVAIDRYNGEPYGDEEDGSSQVVARDTAEPRIPRVGGHGAASLGTVVEDRPSHMCKSEARSDRHRTGATPRGAIP